MKGEVRRVVFPLAACLLLTILVGCKTTGNAKDIKDNIKQIEQLVKASPIGLKDVPLTIDIDDNGRVTKVADFDAQMVDRFVETFTGNPLIGRLVLIDKRYVGWFKRSDIQHMTLASRPEGLFVLVNGRAMPHLAWDDASFENLLEALGKFQKEQGQGAYLLTPDTYDVLSTALPFVKALGARIDVRFPLAAGHTPIALPDDSSFDVGVTDAELDAKPAQTIDLTIDYRSLKDDQGWVPTFFGLTTLELQSIGNQFDRKLPLLRLRQDIRTRLVSKGITQVGVQSRVDGLYLAMNDKVMPHLAWSEEELMNLSGILQQLYPEGIKLPKDAKWVPAVRSVAPMLNNFAVALQLRFPSE